MPDKIRNTKSFMTGLVTGGILGGLAALLYAPQTGKKLRRDISEKTDDILFETNQLIENAKEKASDIICDATKKTEKMIEEGMNKVETMIECATDKVKKGEKKIETISKEAEKLMSNGKEIVEDGFSRIQNALK